MRAYSWAWLLTLSVLNACGGESALNEKRPSEGEGGSGEQPGDEPEAGAGDTPGGGTGARPSTGSGGSSGDAGAGAMSQGGGEPTPPSSGGVGVGGSAPVAGSPGRPPKGIPIPFPPTTGGAPGMLPAEPAVGCEPYSQSTGPGYCEIFRQCENTTVYANCSDQGSGSMSCTCQNGNAYASYAIKDVTGLPACEAIADLCAAGGQPKLSGEETCGSTYASKSAYNCNLQGQCTRALEGNSAISVITSSTYVDCFNDGGSGLYCYCSAGGEYRLSGTDGNNACDIVQDLCSGESVFEEKRCAPQSQSSSAGYCDASYECRETKDLGNGTIVTRSEYRYANCQALSGGVTTCSCGSNTAGYQFEYVGTASSGTCATAAELCGDPSALELTGAIDCGQASQSAGRDYCSSTLECVQSGKLGTLDVKAYGYLQTNCNPSADGKSWTCGCYSGSSQATTTFERTADSWADCTAASDQCRGLVEIQIGSSGGVIGRPIPLAR